MKHVFSQLRFIIILLLALPLVLFSMEENQQQQQEQFNWVDLPQDIKNKIIYEHVGVTVPLELVGQFIEDGTENQNNDFDNAEQYYDNMSKVVSLGTSMVKVWNPVSKKEIWKKAYDPEKKKFTVFDCSQKRDLIACGDSEGHVIVFDFQTGAIVVDDFDMMQIDQYNTRNPAITKLFFDHKDQQLIGYGFGLDKARDMKTGAINSGCFPSKHFQSAQGRDAPRYQAPIYQINKNTMNHEQEIIGCAVYLPNGDKLIKRWRTYLNDKRKVDPLFAHVCLQEVTALVAGKKSSAELTQKEKLYFKMIERALHRTFSTK